MEYILAAEVAVNLWGVVATCVVVLGGYLTVVLQQRGVAGRQRSMSADIETINDSVNHRAHLGPDAPSLVQMVREQHEQMQAIRAKSDELADYITQWDERWGGLGSAVNNAARLNATIESIQLDILTIQRELRRHVQWEETLGQKYDLLPKREES